MGDMKFEKFLKVCLLCWCKPNVFFTVDQYQTENIKTILYYENAFHQSS